MKSVYPIILTPDIDGYVISVPDFDIMTQGKDIAEALDMARDAISLMSVDYQDSGKQLPTPSAVNNITVNENDIVTLVDVDITAYRRMLDNRSVKKNCTIPSWLNVEAEKAHINFSAVLQEALKEQLHLNA